MKPILLASQSPRRKQLLEWAEIPFRILVSDADEGFDPGMEPARIAIEIAKKKAGAVKQQAMPGEIILAADTIVVLGDHIIGKPVHREDAVSMLLALSGSVHEVITGVVLVKDDEMYSFHDLTRVTFHELTLQQVEFYIDKYKPYDKAGAYAIQEWIGVVGIRYIEGDFYNVMGLPVSRVIRAIKALQEEENPGLSR